MAVVVPVIAAWGAAAGAVAAAGGVVAAMSTAAGFLSVAGAALTTIGAVTKKKDLLRIGGIMSLAGGVGSAFNAASKAASAASTTSSGMSAAENSAFLAANEPVGNAVAQVGAETAAGVPSGYEALEAASNFGEAPLLERSAELASTQAPTISQMQPGAAASPSMASAGMQPSSLLNQPYGEIAQQVNPFTDSLGAGGAGIKNQTELMTLLKSAGDKAKTGLGTVTDWISKNPELTKIGGSMLESMYGPKSEQFDYDKSIYERRLRNLNTPIRMGRLSRGG